MGRPRADSADGQAACMIAENGPVDAEDIDPVGWIREIVLDAVNPWDLASFWAGLLGGTPTEWYPGWVTLEPPPRGLRLSFQATEAQRPAGAAPTPIVHFDVLVSDLDAAHERVVTAGAITVG
jgi:hypothetical protein